MTTTESKYLISALYIYPVKSLAGYSVPCATVLERGFAHDRRWMVTDSNYDLLTQREYPRMALIKTAISQHSLTLSCAGHGTVALPLEPPKGPLVTARVWNDRVPAQTVGPEADRWLTEVIGTPCHLVFMPENGQRAISPTYAPEGLHTSFADSLPYLVIGQAALEGLNQRLPQPVLIDRLRPNIVFTGGPAHAEDHWQAFTVNDVTFRVGKPCQRCMLINVNQQSGEKSNEPLRTMSQYRNFDGRVMFGQTLVALQSGLVHVGDVVQPRLKK